MSSFALPDLGEGLQDAEIVTWHVAEGDRVVADQPLVSVETDKAVVEIPSPQAGSIERLLARPGERVRVGAPIVIFVDGPRADVGAIVGELAGSAAPSDSPGGRRALATPAIRALAQALGVDLARVAGSGPGGAIARADVEQAARAGVPQASGEALKGVRRAMAINMARAGAEVVPATVWDEADIESWWSPGADVTARLVRAITTACAAEPALNAWYDGRTVSRRLLTRVDLGIAVDTEDGLIVPVVRDVGRRDAAALRRDLDVRKEMARKRTIARADLQDATITLSNFGTLSTLGTLAGRQAALVIVPPQVAIVGAGRIVPQAVPHQAGVAFHHMLPLSLTFDHRAVSGGEAARFLATMIEDLRRAT
jgi:pyruvate dehydrogenase E2 component (dihydrolipoamide acetyltransferase)